MGLTKTDFETIEESDFLGLIEAKVPEGLLLDYKLTCYGNSDKDKKELLKDVSAFANSQGGHLVLGIGEKEGVASTLAGVNLDTDSEILRMEQIIRYGLEPAVSGIRIKSIALTNKNKIILVRIPRSWVAPHRVVFKKTNRFYIRHSAGVHEPSIEELRTLFSQSSNALDKSRKFRDERISEISSGAGLRPLVGEGRLFLHIIPVAALSGTVNIDLEEALKKNKNFWPFGASGMSPTYNYHGFINERGGDENVGYTQVFRNGIIEAAKSKIVRNRDGYKFIPGLAFETQIFQKFHEYIDGLEELNVPPPLIVLFTLEGVGGIPYVVNSNQWGDYVPPLPDSTLRLPECFIQEYGKVQDYQKAIKPAFDALWNAIGYSKSQFFDNDGVWVGKTN